MEQMLEAELTEHLGYEPYEAKGRNSGNSRNGSYEKTIRTSAGDTKVRVPRDRKGEFEPAIVRKYASNTSELEEKILALYAKGNTNRDIEALLGDAYGIEVSPQTISKITDKIWPAVESWQNRALSAIYAIVYLDAIHLKVRREGKVENTAVYIVMGIDLDGHRDVLGHWVGEGAEGANFWMSVLTDLQQRGVEDIFIASVDNLTGFDDAIRAVFPDTWIQGCVIHQIRASLRYVSWKDRKAFTTDLKSIYKAPTRDEAEAQLERLHATWGEKYAIGVRSWMQNWDRLATFFEFPSEIRRLIYTTNSVEAYNRQIRKVTKAKSSFPSAEAVRKLMYLVNQDITRKWDRPIWNWPIILNQLAIRFEGRMPL
jgi:transposase-like protein